MTFSQLVNLVSRQSSWKYQNGEQNGAKISWGYIILRWNLHQKCSVKEKWRLWNYQSNYANFIINFLWKTLFWSCIDTEGEPLFILTFAEFRNLSELHWKRCKNSRTMWQNLIDKYFRLWWKVKQCHEVFTTWNCAIKIWNN